MKRNVKKKQTRYFRFSGKQRVVHLNDREADYVDSFAFFLGVPLNQGMLSLFEDQILIFSLYPQAWLNNPERLKASLFNISYNEMIFYKKRYDKFGHISLNSPPKPLKSTTLKIRTANSFICETLPLVSKQLNVSAGEVFKKLQIDFLIRNEFLGPTGNLPESLWEPMLKKIRGNKNWLPYRIPLKPSHFIETPINTLRDRFSPLLDQSSKQTTFDIRFKKDEISIFQSSLPFLSSWFGRSTENYLRLLYLCFLIRHNILDKDTLKLRRNFKSTIRNISDWKLRELLA